MCKTTIKKIYLEGKILSNKQELDFFHMYQSELSPFIQTIEYKNGYLPGSITYKIYRLCTGQRMLEG